MCGPISMAALTTFASGCFLLASRVLPYVQIGTFVSVVMASSWTFATLFFLSLVSVMRPRNSCSAKPIRAISKEYVDCCEETTDGGESNGEKAVVMMEEVKKQPEPSAPAEEKAPLKMEASNAELLEVSIETEPTVRREQQQQHQRRRHSEQPANGLQGRRRSKQKEVSLGQQQQQQQQQHARFVFERADGTSTLPPPEVRTPTYQQEQQVPQSRRSIPNMPASDAGGMYKRRNRSAENLLYTQRSPSTVETSPMVETTPPAAESTVPQVNFRLETALIHCDAPTIRADVEMLHSHKKKKKKKKATVASTAAVAPTPESKPTPAIRKSKQPLPPAVEASPPKPMRSPPLPEESLTSEDGMSERKASITTVIETTKV